MSVTSDTLYIVKVESDQRGIKSKTKIASALRRTASKQNENSINKKGFGIR